ncbi:putative endothelial lipase [Folsomia candida]|uniref:Putative endothelial lipase n=1 Tax=Folsomia candida TaxID=158441 RepID=A0A226DHP2_FOLCA|nr:putative endothelial lipase [Folsomia candida]OXA44689.1 putative endothelial lipase [Folsomia candida]
MNLKLPLILLIFACNLLLFTSTLLLPFEIGFDPNKIKFLLVKGFGLQEEIKYQDKVSLQASSYKPGGLTVFFVHGFGTPGNLWLLQKNVVLPFTTDSPFIDNFIFVDWTALSGNVIFPLDLPLLYPIAVKNVAAGGKRLANFIEWLYYDGSINLDRIHLVGISLGAHLVGRAGAEMQLIMGGRKLPRITGLDPAGPLYYPSHPDWNIDKSDASFVDIYHSNAGFYGESTLGGHVDFILNNGHAQPECNVITDLLTCSHSFSVYLFADSFKNAYVACQCSSRELDPGNFKQCQEQCPNPVFAGVYTPHTTRGEYQITAEHLHTLFDILG